MKTKNFVFGVLALGMLFFIPLVGNGQNCEPLNTAQLKKMLTELGYTTKDLETKPGKEKYEVKHTLRAFDVPVGYEISPSTNFIWLTVMLGKHKTDTSYSFALLKHNAKIQPCFFYITASGNLMMGLAVENRGVTNAILRKHTDKILNDVIDNAAVWK